MSILSIVLPLFRGWSQIASYRYGAKPTGGSIGREWIDGVRRTGSKIGCIGGAYQRGDASRIGFIATVERSVPPRKVIHAIFDNYAAHKHPEELAWLAAYPRWTFHFTPTSCSWLNAVEGFSSKLTNRSQKRGVFRSVDDLKKAIS